MTRTLVVAVLLGAATLAGCGGGGLSADQQKLFDEFIADIEADGFDIDNDCARDAIAKIPDGDAAALVNDPSAVVPLDSPEAREATTALVDCIDFGFDPDAVPGDLPGPDTTGP